MPDLHRTTVDVPPGWTVEIVRTPCACPEGFACAPGDPFRALCPRQTSPLQRVSPMIRTVSPAGRAALMTREGCRLAAYRDGVGVPTIGVGHTGRASPPAVALGMTITRDDADAIFARDLAPFEAAVVAAVPASLTVNQFDACVSLAFNIGVHGFTGSTVVHKLAGGDRTAAADAFLMWVHPPELAARRRSERAQFLRPDGPVFVAAATATPNPDPHGPAPAGGAAIVFSRAPGLLTRILALFRKAA